MASRHKSRARHPVDHSRHSITLERWVRLVGPRVVLQAIADCCYAEGRQDGDWRPWVEAGSKILALAETLPDLSITSLCVRN